MESKTKKILALGLSGIFISSIILMVIFLPIFLQPPSFTFSVSIPDLTIDANKPACNRTINVSDYVTPALPNSQISISTNYTNAPWNTRVSIMGTNLTFQTFNFPMNGYYSIKITVTYQGVSNDDEIKILLTGKNTWTWMSGNYSLDNNGTYGMKGVANADNVPGARSSMAAWKDISGNFWLFGGLGYDNQSGEDYLNDLWTYNVSDSTWTWVSGNYSRNNKGTYGTKGLADADNVPGARVSSATWTDISGNFWLFGGVGYNNATAAYLNDLWMYNISDSTWIWVSGNYSTNNPGIYGTSGVADPSNMPGARFMSIGWIDTSGSLWLFGGNGYDHIGATSGYLNDLWKYVL